MTTVLRDNALEKQISLTLGRQDVLDHVLNFLKNKAAKVKVDGFRVGKAPVDKIFPRFGDEAIRHAVQVLIQEPAAQMREGKTLMRVVNYDIRTSLAGADLKALPDLEVVLTAVYRPKVNAVDLAALTVPAYQVVPSESEVDEEVAGRARQTLTSIPLETKRPAEKGDTLTYTMHYDDGKGYSKDVDGQFRLGSGMLPKEFEAALEGVSEGFVLREKLRVPEGFPDKNLAGQKVSFSIQFHEIRQTVPFEVGEEFAQHQGSENLEAYRDKVRHELIDRGKGMVNILQRRQLGEALMKTLAFEVPSLVVDEMVDGLRRAAMAKNKSQGGSDVLSADQEAKLRARADAMVRLECWIRQMAEDQKIEMTNDELVAYARVMAYREQTSLDNVIAYLRQNPREVRSIEESIIERKVLDWALEQCARQDQVVTMKELRAALDQESLS